MAEERDHFRPRRRRASAERDAVAPLRGAGRERYHRPDLVVAEGGAETALELELTAKGRARLERVLAAYVRSPRYRRVRYLVPAGGERTAAALARRARRRAGADRGRGARRRRRPLTRVSGSAGKLRPLSASPDRPVKTITGRSRSRAPDACISSWLLHKPPTRPLDRF